MAYIRPHVILEGPDGSGKTTLANALRARGYTYHHEGLPNKENMLQEYAKTFLAATKTPPNHPVVFDRMYFGEIVYGPLMRNHDRLTPHGAELMRMLAKAQGSVNILCLPPYQDCKNNWFIRESEYVKDESIYQKIYNTYGFYSHHFDCVYDYTSRGSRDACLNMLQWNRQSLGQDFVGDPNSRIVIYGDTPNQELDLPFFSLTNSSAFLHDILKIAGYRISDLLFCNCYDPNDEPHNLIEGLKSLDFGPRVIVALGFRAKLALQKIGITNFGHTFVFMQHPQYIKRFKASQMDLYASHFSKLRSLVFSGNYHEFLI